MVKNTVKKIAKYLESELELEKSSTLLLPLIYGKEWVDIIYPDKDPYVMATNLTLTKSP